MNFGSQITRVYDFQETEIIRKSDTSIIWPTQISWTENFLKVSAIANESPLCPTPAKFFERIDVSDLFEKRLRGAVARVYNAAKPIVLFATSRIPCPPIKIHVPLLVHNNVIYHFMCRYESAKVGRT